MSSSALDVSVIVPFADSEETIGRAVSRVASHLRELGCQFEILCVDEDSRDNSPAVLRLMRGTVPELRVQSTSGRGRGFAAGAALARGAVLWMLTPEAACCALSPFGGALRRITGGHVDMVVLEGRFTVCRRTRVFELLHGVRGGPGIHERLARRARSRNMQVERHRTAGGASNRSGRPWSRLFDTGPLRVALSWIDSES